MEREVGMILTKLQNLEEDMQEAKQSRKLVYEKIEATNTEVHKLAWRMDALEATMNKHAPTIAEFLTYKEQVRGAGKLGKLLWFIGGIVLSAAASIAGWFHWK